MPEKFEKQSEETPDFRIVGNAPEEEKEKAKEELHDILFHHVESLSEKDQENVKKYEFPKTEKEISLINFANEETNRLRKKQGLKTYEIPAENYHIVPHEYYKNRCDESTNATTFFDKQAMVFDVESARTDPLVFGGIALHETLHLKGAFTLEVGEKEVGGEKNAKKIRKTGYREGVSVKALQRYGLHGNYHEHFVGLHEAIVATRTKKSFLRLLDSPELAEQKKWLMSDEARQIKQKISQERAEKEKLEIPEDEFVWVSEDGKNWERFSYQKPREVLDYVCVEIQKQFPEQYQNMDEVFEEFLKAHFTGRLLTIARLVEKTFGKGGFRTLGNMTTESSSAVSHLESLQKAKIAQNKANKHK